MAIGFTMLSLIGWFCYQGLLNYIHDVAEKALKIARYVPPKVYLISGPPHIKPRDLNSIESIINSIYQFFSRHISYTYGDKITAIALILFPLVVVFVLYMIMHNTDNCLTGFLFLIAVLGALIFYLFCFLASPLGEIFGTILIGILG